MGKRKSHKKNSLIELNLLGGFDGALFHIYIDVYNTVKRTNKSHEVVVIDDFTDDEDLCYYKMSHPLSRAILLHLLQKEYNFKFGYTEKIVIKKVEILSKEAENILFDDKAEEKILDSENKVKDVYVYDSFYNSYIERSCECVTAYVRCSNINYLLPVNVCYDEYQDKYYISRVLYDRISKLYGLPALRLTPYKNKYFNQSRISCDFSEGFSEKSKLALYGYSVSNKEGLSEKERRGLLTSLIDYGLMSKSEIIEHLSWCVDFYGYNSMMTNACKLWEQDLVFISNYKKQEQRKILAKFIQNK